MLNAALSYAEMGFAVFPCIPRGKAPVTSHGFKDATKKRDEILALWRSYRGANVAIATGAISGIVVLDIDPRHGGDDAIGYLEGQYGELPRTPVVKTGGGGWHFYFRHPGGVISNSAGKVGRGIDVRGDGGYVIAPRSSHASGNRYLWQALSRIDQIPLAELPDWLLGRISAGTDSRDEPRSGGRLDLGYVSSGVLKGHRDDQIFRLACFLRQRGYTREQAEPVVLDAAARCRPPFHSRDAMRKLASAWRYA
jgi:hypothetical protein